MWGVMRRISSSESFLSRMMTGHRDFMIDLSPFNIRKGTLKISKRRTMRLVLR